MSSESAAASSVLLRRGPIQRRWGVDGAMLIASVFAHLALGVLLATGPRYAPGGEGGFVGAGGPTVEVGIVGSPAEAHESPVAPVAPAPTTDTEADTESVPRRPELRRVERAPTPAPPAVEVRRRHARNVVSPEGPTPAELARQAVLGPAPGTGADVTSGGRAPGEVAGAIAAAAGRGTVGEARDVLLASGSFCEDPVVGTWVAQKYKSEAGRGRWVRFTLEIDRSGNRLSGRILSRIWDGGPSDPTPPECRAFHSDMTWAMQGRGLVVGDTMTFGSHHARVIRTDCPGHGAYAPDNFSGRINPEAERFDARNNDGAYDIDEPYTFRRVACD